MNHHLVISYPALSAIAASLYGLAEAIQYAVDNGVSGHLPCVTSLPHEASSTRDATSPLPTDVAPPSLESSQPGIGLAEIRALLAERCESGKEDEVRALIAGFGADKLSQVDPQHYPTLLQAAEALSITKEENPC